MTYDDWKLQYPPEWDHEDGDEDDGDCPGWMYDRDEMTDPDFNREACDD